MAGANSRRTLGTLLRSPVPDQKQNAAHVGHTQAQTYTHTHSLLLPCAREFSQKVRVVLPCTFLYEV